MNKERLLEIARDIANSLEHQAEQTVTVTDLKQAAEARKLELTPIAGWEGKNAENRELTALKTFAADEALLALDAKLRTATIELSNIAWRIDAMRDERRAIEWMIRDNLVNVLAHQRIVVEDRDEDTAVIDAQAVGQALDLAERVSAGPVGEWLNDAPPF